MSKKILIGIIAALIIIAVIVGIYFLTSNSKKEETKESDQPETGEITPVAMDESVKSMIEDLKVTCTDFLKGDLSGDPDLDCPGFEKSINRSLCLYCYATRDQNPGLCGKINNEPALRAICQRATGTPIDEIID